MTRSRDWFVLRTAPANTLRLAQSLAWANIEAWSPAETLVERRGESRTRRQKRIPVIASFVFVRTKHLMDVLAIREAPSNPHPDFRFMRHMGEMSFLPDSHLDPLRVAEQKGKPIEQARRWKAGDKVRYPASGFEGLTGTVERSKGKSVWVSFPRMAWPVETSAFLLLEADGEPERKAA